MKKIYEVDKLIKPILLKEAEDAQKTDGNEGTTEADNNDKNNDNQESKDVEQKGTEEKSDNQESKDNDNSTEKNEENPEEKSQEENKEPEKKNDANVENQKAALDKINNELTNCATELDNIYKNNNLKKYGMPMENAYKGVARFIWPAIGIGVATTVAFLCIKGIIPAKKVLSKVPLIGRLFQGDRVAINNVKSTLLMTGTNKAAQAINGVGKANVEQQINVNNAQDQGFDAIKQRIANKQATDEDMNIAYQQWKAGNYPSAGPATIAYFKALDNGASPDEAQKAADAANPKLQNQNNAQSTVTTVSATEVAQPNANTNASTETTQPNNAQNSTTDETTAEAQSTTAEQAVTETNVNGTTEATGTAENDTTEQTQTTEQGETTENTNTNEQPSNNAQVTPDVAQGGEQKGSIKDTAQAVEQAANGNVQTFKASNGKTFTLKPRILNELQGANTQVGQTDPTTGGKVGGFVSFSGSNGKQPYTWVILAPGKYGQIDQTGTNIQGVYGPDYIQQQKAAGWSVVPFYPT